METTATAEVLARRAGFALRRGRVDPNKYWLIRDGRLFTPRAGISREAVEALLDPNPNAVPPRGNPG